MRPMAVPLLALLIALAGAARVVTTYSVFSQAWDEPAHVACGLEWWTSGTANCDPTHPPLARIVIAAPLYWKGLRLASVDNEFTQGNRILHANGEYRQNLTLARAGTLLFYFMCALAVYLLGTRLFDRSTAVLAVAICSTLPMVLHVASLAYTDMALVACFALFVYRWLAWLDAKTLFNAVLLGLSAGVSIGSKYSAIPYIAMLVAASGGAILLAQPRPSMAALTRRILGGAKPLLAAALSCLFVLWAIFHFAVAPISPLAGSHPAVDRLVGTGTLLSAVARKIVEIPLPLSGLATGIGALMEFNRNFAIAGEPYYFLGTVRTAGVWYYFPLVLLCLFPVPCLLACLGAAIAAARGCLAGPRSVSRSIILAAPLCVLLTNMLGNLSYAPRHIAAICPFLSILAGAFLVALWRSTRFRLVARAAAAGLLVAQLITSAATHPDYHAYSNLVQRLLPPVSLFDMGKDVGRLSRVLKERGISKLSIAVEGSNDLSKMDLPPFEALVPYRYTTGWIGISEHKLRIHDPHSPPYDGYAWLERYQPLARIGTSIRLYYIENGMLP